MGLTFMKLGSADTAAIILKIGQFKFSTQSIIGYCCYAISFLLYTIVITKFDLSYIVPILGGVVNVAVLIIGITIFQEKVTVMSFLGAAMIIVGIMVINMKR